MQIQVLNDKMDVIWVKTESGGVTSTSFRQDGTLDKIIALLALALQQARAELLTDGGAGSVAQQNSAALELMLDRQLFVHVGHDPVPDPWGLEKRLPRSRGSEVDAIPGLPDQHDVSCEVRARSSEL